MKYFLLITVIILGALWGYTHPRYTIEHVEMVQKAHANTQALTSLPSPSPTPLPVPTTAEIVSEIANEFSDVPKADLVRAINIAFCESGIRTDAYNFNTNATGDHSIFQINDVHTKTFGGKFKEDWRENIRVARKIYDRHSQSFSAWVCNRKIGG